ncbi:MAG: YceI family protein [Ktedonobacteraceae bacterium]
MAWEIDPTHSLVEFSVAHLMISIVKGRFSDLKGTLHLDPKQPENSWVRAEIPTATIQTGVAQRDAHLRSADFFSVAKYPTITFVSTHVKLVDQSHSIMTGDLMLLGVTRSVPFQVEYRGMNRDPLTDAWRIGMFATAMIDRRDFGMTFDQYSGGVFLVGYKVHIEVNTEAVLV